MVNLFREAAVLDAWFMQLARKSYEEGDAVWLSHEDCVRWWEESECTHAGILPSQMNEDERSQFDIQLWTALRGC